MKEIAQALVLAQCAFQPALKNSQNPHFRSKYADLGACIEAVIDALHANDIALIQHTAESDKGVVISTTFLHKSGEIYEAGSLFVPASQQTPQAYGSALTYARRYSLMTACGIAPEDDDGNEASRTRFERSSRVIEDDAWSKVEPPADDMWVTPTGDFKASAQVSADAPHCAHGMMTLKEGVKDGKAYKGYTCPEKDRENQCAARWMIMSKTTGEWRFKDAQ